MKTKFLVLLALFIISVSNPASAQLDVPTTGMLYNTQEAALLTYDCKKLDNKKLECQFIQTSVRKKLKPDDLKEKINEAKKQFPEAIKEISSEEMCSEDLPFLDALTGKKTPEQAAATAPKGTISNKEEFIKGIKEMSETQKQEVLKTFSALKNFCKEKTESSYLELTKIDLEKQTNTCIISAGYSFTQIFIHVDDAILNTGVWVVEGTPSGPCGIVQLSRFIPEKSGLKDSDLIFWKYIAKKAITNPDGTVFGNSKCSGFDESEYLYDWKTSPKTDRLHHLNCEYIEFSPL